MGKPLEGEVLDPPHRPAMALATALVRLRALEETAIGSAQRKFCGEACAEIIATLSVHEPALLDVIRRDHPHLMGRKLLR